MKSKGYNPYFFVKKEGGIIVLIYDAKVEKFIGDTQTFKKYHALLKFEISLINISKYEELYEKPFFSTDIKKDDFIKMLECCCISGNFNSIFVDNDLISAYTDYLKDKHTASTIKSSDSKSSSVILTSELIYSLMFELRISKDCETWNINRLLILIEMMKIRQNPNTDNKSSSEIMNDNIRLNEMRKAKYHTKG